MEPAFIQFPSFCLVADFFFFFFFFSQALLSPTWIHELLICVNMSQQTENPTMSAVQQNYNEVK